MASSIEIRRLYEAIDATAGYRVFIDRLWPRGVAKEDFKFDLWCKDLAPSPALRKWFGHKAQHWSVFCDRYRTELNTPKQQQRLQDVLEQARDKPIILLYGAKDPDHNRAHVLAQVLHEQRKGAR